MKRQTIEEYLDGALDAAGRSEVEMMVARDADAGRMMAQSKAERALRTAAYASYAPSKQEASAFAAQVLAACEDEALEPVGSIGVWSWTRRLTSVAAAIAVMAGVFVAGRMTAPVTVVETPVEVVKTRVYKFGPGDAIAISRDYGPNETEEFNNFVNEGTSDMATLDLTDTPFFDPNHL